MKAHRHESSQTWKLTDIKVHRHESSQTWKLTDKKACRYESSQTWKLRDMKGHIHENLCIEVHRFDANRLESLYINTKAHKYESSIT